MGESSKAEKMPYRFTDHYTFLSTFINTVVPSGSIILVLHDWGSALGLHWAYQQHQTASPVTPFRIAGLVLTEFIRPFPTWASMNLDPAIESAFRSFRDSTTGRKAIIDQNILLERLVPHGQLRSLTREELDHRKRPYPDPASRELLWMWTTQIPIEGSPSDVFDIATRYHAWLVGEECEMPKLLFWVTPGNLVPVERVKTYSRELRNVTGVDLGQGLHYPQEDHPRAMGIAICDWVGKLNPLEK